MGGLNDVSNLFLSTENSRSDKLELNTSAASDINANAETMALAEDKFSFANECSALVLNNILNAVDKTNQKKINKILIHFKKTKLMSILEKDALDGSIKKMGSKQKRELHLLLKLINFGSQETFKSPKNSSYLKSKGIKKAHAELIIYSAELQRAMVRNNLYDPKLARAQLNIVNDICSL